MLLPSINLIVCCLIKLQNGFTFGTGLLRTQILLERRLLYGCLGGQALQLGVVVWLGDVYLLCAFFVNFSGSWSLRVLGALHDQGTLWLSSTHYVHNTHALTTMAQVLHNFLSIFVSSCRQFKYVMLLCPLCSWISKMWCEPQHGDLVNNNNNSTHKCFLYGHYICWHVPASTLPSLKIKNSGILFKQKLFCPHTRADGS